MRLLAVPLTLVPLLTACASSPAPAPGPAPAPSESGGPTSSPAPDPVRMPDLTGLTDRAASREIGRVERAAGVVIDGDVRAAPVGCGVRPGTVVRQRPAPGKPIEGRIEVVIQLARLDLRRDRGPCRGRDLGPLGGRDGALARAFYRFAADPSLVASFVPGEVWVGIEAGATGVWLDADERGRLSAWRLRGGYADLSGPLSALDVVASSGGWFEVHPGVVPTCATDRDGRPRSMVDMRAITLTVDPAVADSCMDTWGVTLFLDADDRIAGVALRIGSP